MLDGSVLQNTDEGVRSMTIATRLRLLVVAIVTMTALLIGGIVYFGYASFNQQQRREALSLRSVAESQRLEEALSVIRRDTDLLVGLRLLDQLTSSSPEEASMAQTRLEEIFSGLLRTRKHYSQIRYIAEGAEGREVVRVDRKGKEVVVVPQRSLQSKSRRDYYQRAVAMEAGQVYLHSPTLNRENGVIEVPHRPMLRATGTHGAPGGKIRGLVVINMEMQALFDELYGKAEQSGDFYVANQSGDYLYHPEVKKRFGFDLGKRYLIVNDFPLAPSWISSSHSEESIVEHPSGDVVDFQKVFLDPDLKRFLIFGVGLASEDAKTQTLRIGAQAIVLTASLAIIGLLLAYFVAARTVRPVEKITRIAEQIANGGEPDSLPVDRDDEVGTLARTFSQMLQRLKERKDSVVAVNQQLSQANEDMEYFAQIASHDLREPARRVATMADFLMTDELSNLSEEGRETLERLVGAATKLLDQITDIRSLTQVGQGRLLRERVDLTQEVCGVLLGYESALVECRANSQVADMPPVNVYASLVRVLYAKLIDNALTHSKLQGMRLEFTAELIDDTWTFGVRNTGSSIAEEERRRVFLPSLAWKEDWRAPGWVSPFANESLNGIRGKFGLNLARTTYT